MNDQEGSNIITVTKWQELQKLYDKGSFPMPFSQEILLFECHVAGTGYIPNSTELAKDLQDNQTLSLLREAQNPHDAMAIQVCTVEGTKLGYIPRSWNTIPAHLMDAGKMLFAKILKSELQDKWLHIQIAVYLKDI